ncbi:uncharacterized protein Dwil_GK12929 [Drosophila willistoni]|uniref:CHK kinase-like domain-containing protein n=1 Tax=Drosophila willistoni TaxID=7260 RepID=B4NIL9_DROWI|nr:uncharacterized protein Dwil_GK12929 [Drosophila willistoni]
MEQNSNDQFNADELEAPKWLTKEFITKVLSQYENKPQLEVLNLKISPASAKGDHYASVMFRASVDYKSGENKLFKSLIIKTIPDQDGHKKDILSAAPVFKTEIGMYGKVLPKFEKILQQVGDTTKLYVPCIYQNMEPRQVLIFDDLIPLGYKVMRGREATFKELQCSLSKLAKWHAVSMKVQNEEPDFLKEFKHGMVEMPNFAEEPMVSMGMDNFLQFLKSHPTLAKYIPHFEKMKGNYLQHLYNYMTEHRNNRRADGYYVLCHGDFHLRNMMFKHDKETGNLQDCMLLDFQMCNLCPITVDVVYAIYMLMGPEQRAKDWENLLNYYFSILLETLKKIGYKDFFMVSTLLPMIWAMKVQSIDISEVVQKNESRQKCYEIPGLVEDMSIILARFERLGYFENL